MNPRSDNEHLSAWLDGELDPAEAAALESELAADPELRAELEALESVVGLLREEGPTRAPPGFDRRLMARIEQEFPERPSWWAWMRRPWGIPLEGWVLGLAAAAALLLVLPIGLRTGEAPPGWADAPPVDGVSPQERSPAAVEPVRPQESAEPLASSGPRVEKVERGPEGKGSEVIGRATTGEDSIPREKRVQQARPEVAAGEGAPSAAPEAASPPPPLAPPALGTAEEGTSGYRLVVQSEDAGMKREILAIASRYGTGATDLERRPITDGQMRSGTEELILSIPNTDLTSFARDLAAEGYRVETRSTPEDLVGSSVEVRIRMQLVGGAPKAAAPIPNASHRAAESHDALEEITGD